MTKKVAVVILNFKVLEETLKCISSVKQSDYPNFEIIVVDNHSLDGSEAKLNEVKDILFIQTGVNKGYAGGNNVGIKLALENGADFVLILNPDTTIEKDCISRLISSLEKHHAAIANPKIYFMNSKHLWFAGKRFDKLNVLASHRGVDELDRGQYDEEEVLEDATGAALMVSKKVFEKTGFFDERYFLYYEESDFCFRARKDGFKIMYVPKAVVYHANAKSTGLGSPLQDYFITRNRMLFASKFLSARTQFALFREGLRNLKIPSRRQALIDFWVGNFGKGSFKI